MDYFSIIGLGIVLFLGGVGVVYFVSYRAFLKQEEEKKIAWAPLIIKNPQLEYISAGSFDEEAGYVIGYHRKHQIKLDTIFVRREDKPPHIYTRLTIPIREEKGISLKPVAVDDVVVLFSASDKLKYPLKGNIYVQRNERKVEYEQYGIEKDANYLLSLLDYLIELVAIYPALVMSGGGITSYVQEVATNENHRLQYLAYSLLQDIAEDTTLRLRGRLPTLICPHCYTRFKVHQIVLPGRESVMYYGCRICYQSCRFIEGQVVARLDEQAVQEVYENSVLWVNWLSYRQLFDFDRVEITKAMDENIERFAVQVANDTDEVRRHRYTNMECSILPDCELSINSIRILQRIFGKVERL